MYRVEKADNEYQKVLIPGYTNHWSAFEKYEKYFIMENDYWGDETCCLVCEFSSGSPIVVCETYDDIFTALKDEGILE